MAQWPYPHCMGKLSRWCGMRSQTIKELLAGGNFEAATTASDYSERFRGFMERLVELLKCGALREVTVLRHLLDSPEIWLPDPYFFRHGSGATYRLLSYDRTRVGSFTRVKGAPVPEVSETDPIASFEDDTEVREWLRTALENRLLDEVTLLDTWGTPAYRSPFESVFETTDGDFLMVMGPDGPFRGWYGRLGDFAPCLPPSKLWLSRDRPTG